MLVKVCYSTFCWRGIVILYNSSSQTSAEIVLLDETFLKSTLSREKFVQILVWKIWMQTHHSQGANLLLHSFSVIVILRWFTWGSWNSTFLDISSLLGPIVTVIISVSSGSSVLSIPVLSESLTSLSSRTVFSDASSFVSRTTTILFESSVTSVTASRYLDTKKFVYIAIASLGLIFLSILLNLFVKTYHRSEIKFLNFYK